ncbi:hypothetical protein EIP86_010542 [Pleurotus ostreatoroseus]|nr:hypothetical protein EIP86_010542 [Pleurotus ostreatoroseus]
MSAQLTHAKPHITNGFLDVPKEPPKGCKPTARPLVARGKLINNIANSSETDRENFLIAMTRPLVMYGATLNMLEDKLLAVARHFNVKVTVVRKSGEFSCVLGDYGNLRRKIKVCDRGRRTLRHIGVVEVDSIVFDVTHDNVAMKDAMEILGNMEKRGPLKNPFLHVACASALSALICMHAFQATGREVLYTLLSTFMLCVVHMLCKRAGMLAAAFLE